MTDERMALIELIENDADTDLVREMLSFAAERLMEAEVEARTGAGHGLRDPGASGAAQRLSGTCLGHARGPDRP